MRVMIPKKKKIQAGLLPLKLIIIGVNITHIEHPNQFMTEEYGNDLDGMISET